ncbi:phiSA1p31-related protein [Streptomyces sp. NRRL S-15]|uniref:phiSA1p31-related protein n=1 Tax=Streptomyces sp. NRRL S-15 TaxID=1463886 RepID=UPI0004C88BCE|nr:phiSA1p31-related protein [Streptomyces sp. NRRL S-15]
MTNTFTFEGIEFDLSISYSDTVGVEWTWAGAWTADGEPLMRTLGVTTLVSLPDVYWKHGPLIPIHPRPSAAQFRAAVDPDYEATVAAGYVETPTQFTARTSPAPVPVPAGSAFTSPLEDRGFRAFIRTISRGNR